MEKMGIPRLQGPVYAPKSESGQKKIEPLIKRRERGGRQTMIEQFVTRGIDRSGLEQPKYNPKKGMSKASVDSIFSTKALLEKGILVTLVNAFKGDAVKQIRVLENKIQAAGGNRPSSRRELATFVAKGIRELQKLSSDTVNTTAEESRRFLASWTWLISNGFALGDEKTHMDDMSRKNHRQRDAAAKKFDASKLELEAEIQDKIGEELDQVVRWARGRQHNLTLKNRIKESRGRRIDLNKSEFQKVSIPKFPEKGLVAYLASKFPEIAELKYLASSAPLKNPERKAFLERKNEIMQTLTNDSKFPYDPYTPVSAKRKGEMEHARKAALETLTRGQKRTVTKQANQAQEKRNAEQQILLDREKSEERIKKLRPLAALAQQRFEKAKSLLKAIELDLRNQPGPLRSIAIRIDPHLLKLHADFIEQAKRFEKSDSRSIFGKLVGKARGVGQLLTQNEFDRLKGLFGRAERKHWQTLEKHINQIRRGVLRDVPEKMRKNIGLSDVELDKMNANEVGQLIRSLKQGFGFIQGGLEARVKDDLKMLREEVLPKLQTRLKNLPKDHPDHQSLDSRVKYLQILTNANNTNSIDNRKATLIQRQAARYRSAPEIK